MKPPKLPPDKSIDATEYTRIEKFYRDLQGRIRFTDVPGKEHWVTPEEAKVSPVHRWYTLKESFSPDFVKWVISQSQSRLKLQHLHILDPFGGAGTTGVVATQTGCRTDLIEYNPFIRLVAQAKVSAKDINPDAVNELMNVAAKPFSGIFPALSTANNSDYFRREDVEQLVSLLQWVNETFARASDRNVCLIIIAWVAQEIANLRKDGRALRYQVKPQRILAELLQNKCLTVLEDLRAIKQKNIVFQEQCRVLRGSATDFTSLVEESSAAPVCLSDTSYDLVFYSPPYLNNFDYSEVYKIELWILGLIRTQQEWRDLRMGTLRSHSSINFLKTSILRSTPETRHIYDFLVSLGESSTLPARTIEMFIGYFEDMFISFKEQFRVLKSGGEVAYNVANSRYRMVPIATDLLLMDLARAAGFTPKEIFQLRHRNGRTKHKAFLRESLVLLRKP